MKDRVKAGLAGGLYVGLVYAIGSYLGYRLGKSKGHLDAELEHMYERYELNMDKLMKEYPELFKDEEEA